MATITAEQVKTLRERTGAGMMECKQALVAAEGNLDQAEIAIAKAGKNKAEKKEGRTAAEGLVVIKVNPEKTQAALVEINCETDFVAKDANFTTFCQQVAETVFKMGQEGSAVLLAPEIEEERKLVVAKIGENIQCRRAAFYKVGQNILGAYVHHSHKIGVLVELSGGSESLAKDLAMHIAASRPKYLTIDEVDAAELAKQTEIYTAQAESSGKPEAIRAKIVQGMISKHFSELCLVGQPFFKDPDKTIAVVLKDHEAKIVRFTRLEVGEGIEVKKVNFQEEVMAQLQGDR